MIVAPLLLSSCVASSLYYRYGRMCGLTRAEAVLLCGAALFVCVVLFFAEVTRG